MFFSHGFGGVAGSFGVDSRGIIDEVGHFWTIPGGGSVVVFVKFDFQVNLHIHYNSTSYPIS